MTTTAPSSHPTSFHRRALNCPGNEVGTNFGFSATAQAAADECVEIQIASELMTYLAYPGIRPGQALPPLALLARDVGLGQPAVSAALDSLTLLGILARTGKNYFLKVDSEHLLVLILVRRPVGDAVAQQLDDARLVLLKELSGLAAAKRTVEDSALLARLISDIQASAETSTTERDILAIIVRLARERVLRAVFLRLEALAPDSFEARNPRPVQGYRSVLQMIRSGLPQPARDEMAAYLSRTRGR